MCGIYCSLSRTNHISPDERIAKRLQARGPDASGTVCTIIGCEAEDAQHKADGEAFTVLHSTVLGLRGSQTVGQPYQDKDSRFTLCWNGEAWGIDGERPIDNDTAGIHRILSEALGNLGNCDANADPFEPLRSVAVTLSRVAGPYAFVLLDHERRRIFFGRDFLGRRSLLKKITDEGDLVICSVSDGNAADGWTEIEPDGIYCIDQYANDETVVPSGIQVQRWGSFAIGFVPYNFADLHTNVSPMQSVIPRLVLNKDISTFQEDLSEQSPAVATLAALLTASLSLRVLHIPDSPANNAANQQSVDLCKLAILFSGGVDCTILARLSHDLLPNSEPIDLLNVAFENPRIHKSNGIGEDARISAYESCPDRITGRASYAELCRVCPARKWRFVSINIPYTETQEHRQQIVSLMHPHNTEMDLSICNALYFAARGEGDAAESSGNESVPYKTPARVLLSGLGADELFAGYIRHATAFKRSGLEGLIQELELDVARLGKRNLGRDDRVMSHWGKEVRFPYLDENLLRWALKAPVTQKCGFCKPDLERSLLDDAGDVLEPGKKVLRCLAWKLGMKGVAKERKRAIQFGARTAKMETGKTKGTHQLT